MVGRPLAHEPQRSGRQRATQDGPVEGNRSVVIAVLSVENEESCGMWWPSFQYMWIRIP